MRIPLDLEQDHAFGLEVASRRKQPGLNPVASTQPGVTVTARRHPPTGGPYADGFTSRLVQVTNPAMSFEAWHEAHEDADAA